MADQTVTDANVLISSSVLAVKRCIAGAAVERGEPIYLDSADNYEGKPADASAAATAVVAGIALNQGGDQQPIDYVEEDPDFNPGFSCTEGEIYVLSATTGRICLKSDLGGTDYVSILGVGKANGKMYLRIINSGAQN